MKIRRLVNQYYNKWYTLFSSKEQFQIWDEKEKQWTEIPTSYTYHYPYSKDKTTHQYD